MPCAGVFDEEIDGPLAGLEVHELPAVTEVAGGGEAVLAPQVAVVGDVEAHGLHRGRDHLVGELAVVVCGKEDAALVHFQQLAVGFPQGLLGELALQRVQGRLGTCLLQRRFQMVQKPVGRVVHHGNAAAVDV